MDSGERHGIRCSSLRANPVPSLHGWPGAYGSGQNTTLATHYTRGGGTIWPLAPARALACSLTRASSQRYSPGRARYHAMGRGTQSPPTLRFELRHRQERYGLHGNERRIDSPDTYSSAIYRRGRWGYGRGGQAPAALTPAGSNAGIENSDRRVHC